MRFLGFLAGMSHFRDKNSCFTECCQMVSKPRPALGYVILIIPGNIVTLGLIGYKDLISENRNNSLYRPISLIRESVCSNVVRVQSLLETLFDQLLPCSHLKSVLIKVDVASCEWKSKMTTDTYREMSCGTYSVMEEYLCRTIIPKFSTNVFVFSFNMDTLLSVTN